MPEIICEYCGNRLEVSGPNDIPEDCPNCNQPLEGVQLQASPQSSTERPLQGLTLMYLKTNASVTLNHAGVMLLGREATAGELLGTIDYISREHCKIEARDGQYYVTDLGSTNGTFLGTERTDCFKNPRQRLHDGDMLTLGREVFRVTLNYGEAAQPVLERSSDPLAAPAASSETPEEPTRYECQDCHNYWSDEKEFVCPKCGTFND